MEGNTSSVELLRKQLSSKVGDSDRDSEGNSSVVAAALAALFGDDGLSDSEDSDDDEDEDAAQTTRSAAQLDYERIPIVEDVWWWACG